MTEPTTAVDVTSVFRRRLPPHVEWVQVNDDAVAWNSEKESLHLLDPIATLVFQLMDGTASVQATVDDLAEAFARPGLDIERDVLACVANLEEIGMLERVS